MVRLFQRKRIAALLCALTQRLTAARSKDERGALNALFGKYLASFEAGESAD